MSECNHFEQIQPGIQPAPAAHAGGCAECVKLGERWVHLRQCLICGHVGCCDSSPRRHATAHFHGTAHPVMRSVEPGEKWGWCYVHEKLRELA